MQPHFFLIYFKRRHSISREDILTFQDYLRGLLLQEKAFYLKRRHSNSSGAAMQTHYADPLFPIFFLISAKFQPSDADPLFSMAGFLESK
jgi:hypothetical protein